MASSNTYGLIALVFFGVCLLYNQNKNDQRDFLAETSLRDNYESQQELSRKKRFSDDDNANVVKLKENPFPPIILESNSTESANDSKNANQFLLPGWSGVPGAHPVVHTQVVHPGVVGHPPVVLAGETRRDRLRRLLRKLLSERAPVAVPVPVPVVPAAGDDGLVPIPSFEGSYVAVAGRPGERTVHIVNGKTGVEISGTVTGVNRIPGRRKKPFLKVDNNENFDYSPIDYNGDSNDYGDYGYDYNDADGLIGRRDPLNADGSPRPGFLGRGRTRRIPPVPRCSYINTDFFGDDVGDGKGLTAASAQECKSACQRSDYCQFWTYRPGWARGCYLKRGRRGDPTPTNAIPKEGYISGTKLDTCICLENSVNSEEQVCPIKTTQYVYPWHRKRPNGYDGNVRFDYDDDDIRRRPIDDGLVTIEPVTLPPPVGIGGTRKTRARTRAGLKELLTQVTADPKATEDVTQATSATSAAKTSDVELL